MTLEKPAQLIADNTADALKSGIYHGFLGQVDGILNRLVMELAYPHIRIIATGGHVEIFAPESALIETVDPNLTLKGLEVFSNQ